MVDIVTRAGKGSPLTNNEVDANFTNLAEVAGVTGEPMGHEDRTTSTISFNASTRTFTIAPVSTSFTVWCKGKKVVVSSAQTVTIPNTTGMYSIYYDANGVLAAKAGYFTFSVEAPTAYVYWNAATGTCPYFGDERHGVVLDWQTHEYLHRTRGAALASGFGASGYTLGGNGTSNAHAQLTLEGGTFFDEDMKIIVTATNTPTAGTWEQDLLSPARIPVLYLSGTGWVIDAPTDYPLKQGTARPQYNALSGGVWSTADVANNKYATSWILATNNLTYPVIAIIGQAESDLQSAAEAVDFTSLQLPGFPSVEFRPLYRLVFQCADSFSNAVKASLVSITDIRSIAAAGVAASLITDHGNLSGLSDDDHPQYLSVDTVRSTLTAAVKASFLPSQTGNAGKFLTTDATSTSWTALTSGNITTALGFTPYNATNPAGYITGITSSDVTTALGFTPYNATNPSGYITTAGARGAISVTGAGSYDSATGVINIVGGVTSFNTRTGAITLSSADVTTALGFTPYNSTNPNGYLTGITSTQVTTALGYTPYNSSNPSGYITGITSGMVTTALGFTPYNNSNPSGYITSSALSGYLTSASAASTYLPLSGGTLSGNILFSGGYSIKADSAINFLTAANGAQAGKFLGIQVSTSYAGSVPDNGILFYTDTTLVRNVAGHLDISGNRVLHAGNYNSYAPTLTGGGASGTWNISISGNAATATTAVTLTSTQSNWGSTGVLANVVGLLSWRNYGNSHVIFDASASLSPSGGAVNNTNSQVAWAATYPTLMGWNGSNTYGVRVDSARVADSAGSTDYNALTNKGGGTGSYVTSGDYRAPIFYDSNDTGFYVDPNGTSRLNGVSVYTGALGFVNAARGSQFGYSSSYGTIIYGVTSGSVTPCINVDPVGNASGAFNGNGGEVMFRNGVTFITPTSANTSYHANILQMSEGNVYFGNVAQASGSLRAPIFYDSNDTTYYLDPNSTTAALLAGSIGVGTTSPVNSAWGTASSTKQITVYGSAYGVVNIRGDSTTATHYSMGVGDGRFYAAYDNVAAIHRLVFFGSFTGLNYGSSPTYNLHLGGTGLATDDWRAPIFYDSNNTGYYVDPASTSNLNNTIGQAFRIGTDSAWKIRGNSSNAELAFEYSTSSTLSDGNIKAYLTGGTFVATGDVRAPIFYDSNNTNYYVDPAAAASGSFAGFVGIGNNYGSDDGGWGSRLNVGGNAYARIDARCANDGIVTTMYSHTGQGMGKIGTYSNHPLALMAQGASTGGYVYSGSIRAPIFYDSDDTTFYVDSNNTSTSAVFAGNISMNGAIVRRSAGTGYLSGNYASSETTATTGAIYTIGGSYYPTSSGLNTMYGIGFTYASVAGGAAGYTGGSAWGLYVASNGNTRVFLDSDYGRVLATGDMRAPIYYDSQDTAYYTDPNSYSNLSRLNVNYATGNGSTSNVAVNISKGWTGMSTAIYDTVSIQANDVTSIRVGEQDGTTGGYCQGDGYNTFTSTSPMRFFTGGSATAYIYNGMSGTQGLYINSGVIYSNGFYDNQDSSYYTDPNGGSALKYLRVDGNWGSSPFGSGSETLTVSGSYASICQRSTISLQAYVLHHVDDRWSLYVGRGATNGSDWNWAIRAMPSQDGNYVEFRTSARAPIFYDYEDTGYYVNPNGSSYLHSLILSGNSYFRPNNWIQMDSSAGIYWPNHYGAHLYPNTGSTYTQIRLDGSKNGYDGMWLSYSAVNGMMYDSAGNGGVYREANGRWYFYHHVGNNCMGVGTATTSSTYGMYVVKGGYFDGRVDGTIFYDANNTTYYVDPNDTGTSVRVAGNVTAYYSDMRLKTHLGKIENALDKVNQLEGFYYEANETAQKLGYKPKREVGVSAQAVQAVLPEIVTDAPINANYLTIDYERLTPLLIEAVKEQNQEVVDLRNRVAQLESLITKLIGD